MRLASLARRTVALTAVTALISGGGFLTGAFVGTANAAAFTVDSRDRNPVNTGPATFRLTSTSFGPSSSLTIKLHKSVPTGQADINGTPADNSAGCVPLPTNCGTTLSFTSTLTNVAPGDYDIVITSSVPMSTPDTCAACVHILNAGAPTITSVARYNGTDGQLVLKGTNLAQDTTLHFVNLNGTDDGALTYVPSTTASSTTTSGYVDSTTFRVTYTPGSGFTPGLHRLRVIDSDNSASDAGGLLDFYQPQLSSVSPSSLGQGANQANVTANGVGFAPTSTFGISSVATTADIAVIGPATVTNTSVLEKVNVTATSAAQARTFTVRGADGGYASSGTVFAVNNGPKFASSTPIAPATRGQGSDSSIQVSGSYFDLGTVFDFGPGATATTTGVTGAATSTSVATVHLIVAGTAPIGARNVVATNTDYGSATLTNGFTVAVAPIVTSLTPASLSANDPTTTVVLNGSGFTSGSAFSLSMVPASNIVFGTVSRVSDNQLQTTITVTSGATSGPRDVIVTNTTNGGTSTCPACFNVNALSVSPSASTTGVTKTLTLTSNQAGAPLSAATTVRIFLPGNPSYQAPINATNVVFNSGNGKVSADVNLVNAATGAYNVETTTPTSGSPNVLLCLKCFTVTSPANPVLLSIDKTSGGQGAVNRHLVLTGSNFTPGETVTFSGTGVTSSNVTFVSDKSITADVTIAPNATVGARNVTVTNNGDGKAGSLTGGFTVNAAPVTTAIDPAQLGQNAVADVTLTGTGYTNDAVADFGAGTTAVLKDGSGAPTTLIYTVTVADNAATSSPRTVTVTNSDGGVGTLANALNITQAPRITALSPNVGKPGDTLTDVVFTGTGFVADTSGTTPVFPTVLIGGVTVTVKSVATDGTSLVADLVISGSTGAGPRIVTIVNPDQGRSTAPSGTFTVATVPGAPTSVVATAGNGVVTVTWDVPVTDGGSPITSYVVDDGDASTNNAVTVDANTRTADVTGLSNGVSYTFTVQAINKVGAGAPGTAGATPYGVPLAPTAVSVAPGNGSLTVSFSGADAQGSPITEYTVRAAIGASEVTATSSGSPITITGLFNGSTYTVTVKAQNAAGYGLYSTASATGTPAYATRLTATRSPLTPISGQSVRYTGTLKRTDGTPLSGALVSVRLTPDVGTSRVINTRTNSSGVWTFAVVSTYNTTVRASFAGDASNLAATATTFRFGVQTRVTRTAPATGQTTSRNRTVLVTGTTSPNKAGRTIGLYRGTALVGRGTVASNGSYAIPTKFGVGTYSLYVQIGTTSGNAPGKSATFVMKRV